MIDYHIHTTLSDGKNEHEAYIQKAIVLGFKEIGFSDHICTRDVHWRMDPEKIPQMIAIIEDLKKKDYGDLKIKFGIEVDFIEGEEEETKRLIKDIPADYIIGAIHFINDWNYDSDPSKFEDKSLYDLYKIYFDSIVKSADSGLFDIIAHPDMIKKFGHYPDEDITHFYEEAAQAFARNNVAVEINTNGLNKTCRDFYPNVRFLMICLKYNVPVTISSDAHNGEQVGQYFEQAKNLLKGLGRNEVISFTNRKRSIIAL